MAQIAFRQVKGKGLQLQYQARFDRMGPNLRLYPQDLAENQLIIREGPAGVFPHGTDTRTPGYFSERSGTRRGVTIR